MNAIGINHIFYKESSDESRHVENGSYLASYSISANIIILHTDDKVKEYTLTEHCSRLHMGNTWELVRTLKNS